MTEDKRLEDIRKSVNENPIPDNVIGRQREIAENVMDGINFMLSEIDRLKETESELVTKMADEVYEITQLNINLQAENKDLKEHNDDMIEALEAAEGIKKADDKSFSIVNKRSLFLEAKLKEAEEENIFKRYRVQTMAVAKRARKEEADNKSLKKQEEGKE